MAVVYEGQLIAERYAPGFEPDMPLLGWSMSKSVTKALVGVLVHQGRLALGDPAPVAEWQSANDPRRKITLDQLMRMSSGLAFEEIYKPLADATDMLYGSDDFAAFAAGRPLAAAPDEKWVTPPARPTSLPASSGMGPKRRPSTTTVLSTRPFSTGSAWPAQSWSPTLPEPSWDPHTRLPPRDAYAAQGFQEQKVIVIPSKKLVLVRFGATAPRTARDTDAFIANVVRALPGSTVRLAFGPYKSGQRPYLDSVTSN